MNIIGKTFDRLTVVANAPNRHGYVVCKCECGNTAVIRQYSLTKNYNPTRSCGCIQKEIVSETGKRVIEANSARVVETNMRYNTNFSVIERETPCKRNTSGYTGVRFNPARGKYEAYINLHYKRINLGRFSKLEDAVEARQKAEEELFAPLIEAKRTESHSAIAIAK